MIVALGHTVTHMTETPLHYQMQCSTTLGETLANNGALAVAGTTSLVAVLYLNDNRQLKALHVP